MASDAHGAASSAAGFHHQTQWALLELLRNGGTRPAGAISIELLDDVAWETVGTPTELLQLKHHLDGQGSLTDGSVDLWKTLAVWMDTVDAVFADGPSLYLITTGVAPEGSAASFLREEDRDVQAAHDLLLSAAQTLSGIDTRKSRAKFDAMLGSDRLTLLTKVHVLDRSKSLDQVRAQLLSELAFVSPAGHEELFLGQVIGWWDGVAVDMLTGRRKRVAVAEAKRAISALRDSFQPDNLPTLVPLSDVDEDALAGRYTSRVFVRQLEAVGFPPRNLRKALVDYYRAYRQTELWIDEDLIGAHELQRFQDDLIDEWEREFEFMIAELPDDASDDDKSKAGMKLLRALLNSAQIKVRPRYDDAFFSRGKRHELADEGRVWWHPDFAEQLRILLNRSEEAS